jgi:hypothetical protein
MLRTASLCLSITFVVLAQGKPASESKPAAPANLEVSTPSYANTTCPLMSKPVKPDLWVDSSHGRVFVCCKNCVARAKKDPDAVYAKAHPTATKVNNTTDPVSGKPVKEGVTVVYQGHEVALESASNAKKFVENGDAYLTLLLKPGVKDLRNTKDPVTGTPVVANTVVLIGDSLVHLASADSVEAVKKDPAKALAAAEKSSKPEKKGS